MNDSKHPHGHLKRGLKNRHIQLIALGGAIGTGLFLGSAGVMKMAGPSMLLGYAIGGIIAFLIMRQLGEMIVEEPVAGSFSHFAYKYWGDFAGFLSGWNYWVLYVLVGMAELTAVAKYVQFWWPDIPQWVPVAVFFIIINAINLANVRMYGEMEFWFAIIKVLAVIGMIVFGVYLLMSGRAGPEAAVSNLWSHGGFFSGGLGGFTTSLFIIMFSFGGLELVGITAAEAAEPRRTIPKAINQVLYRILIFYIGAIAVMLILRPWDLMVQMISAGGDNYGGSPFVMIFKQMGIGNAAHILNFVILTAALSVYNSCVYCNSRMLFGLAEQKNAPSLLAATDRRGVPVLAIGISAAMTLLCVMINYFAPAKALMFLMSLVVAALVINWAMISLTSLKFRRTKDANGEVTIFRSIFFPVGNYLCLAFVLFILGIMVYVDFTPLTVHMVGINIPFFKIPLDGSAISVFAIPFWILFMWLCFLVAKKTSGK